MQSELSSSAVGTLLSQRADTRTLSRGLLFGHSQAGVGENLKKKMPPSSELLMSPLGPVCTDVV